MFGKNVFHKKAQLPVTVPRHVAFIMDGNGRWAKRRGLPRTAGHRAGVETLRRVIRFCGNAGVEAVTFYAFSTENWRRPADEVNTLMDLVVEFFNSEIDELVAEGAVIRILGSRENLPEKVLDSLIRAEERTKGNHGICVNIAFNYGGRAELVMAAKRIAEEVQAGTLALDDIDEQTISDRLYTAGLPDPDLVIRTSAEKRVSNFLLYQIAYSEFAFPETYWPDVNEELLAKWFREFAGRDRRFGGVKNK